MDDFNLLLVEKIHEDLDALLIQALGNKFSCFVKREDRLLALIIQNNVHQLLLVDLAAVGVCLSLVYQDSCRNCCILEAIRRIHAS